MRRCQANLPNRCCRQIDRIAYRAFDGEQWMNREGRAATTGNTYCGNLLWQSSQTLLAPKTNKGKWTDLLADFGSWAGYHGSAKDPKEIAELRGIFKFKDLGSNSSCMCCGHPGVDWWKGDELLARTAVQHLKALRWKRFHGDAELTSEAAEALTAWFSARSIKAAK